jgi:UDP-GlcNAc:undecaprenyl-phosphate GlcNAc-1-phosphate transferase
MQLQIFFLNLIISYLLIYLYKKIAHKFNFVDRPNKFSIHKKNTVTSAGIIFLIIFIGNIFIRNISFKDYLFHENRFVIFIIGASFLSILSFYDDFKNIHPVIRLIFQLTIIFFCTSLFALEKISLPLKLTIFLTIIFWVYIINIINFTDGIDGFLTTNAITFFLSVLFYLKFNHNENFIFNISLIIVPILISFLFFNKPKAKLFMGDSGSIFIGFLVGFISIQFILIGKIDIIISLLCYTFLDCTITIINKVLKKNYPWERLFDYYFLIPVKNKISQKKIFYINLFYNLTIVLIVLFQIIYNLKTLCLISIFLSILLLYYFNSFSNIKNKKI